MEEKDSLLKKIFYFFLSLCLFHTFGPILAPFSFLIPSTPFSAPTTTIETYSEPTTITTTTRETDSEEDPPDP